MAFSGNNITFFEAYEKIVQQKCVWGERRVQGEEGGGGEWEAKFQGYN